jgi:hypothetical protein
VQRKFLTLLIITVLLASCIPSSRATPTPVIPTDTAVPTSIATPSRPLVILELPVDMDQGESDKYQTLVYNLAQANGMRYQVRNALAPADLALEAPSLKIVIVLPPDPDLDALIAAAPDVQFLAVGIPDLVTSANLSTIGASGVPVDQQAFLAGYIAGMVAPEWRTGILYQKDTPGGDAAHTAFENGYHYYCGDCFNPNFVQPFSHGLYPIPVGIPTDTPVSNYSGYADLLIRNLVNVAYVYPAVATPDLLTDLAQNNVLLISQALPGEDVRSSWIASIQPDLISALQNIFPDLLAGHGGRIVPTPLLLADVNSSLLSDAKLRLVQQVLDDLQKGMIGTGVNP